MISCERSQKKRPHVLGFNLNEIFRIISNLIKYVTKPGDRRKEGIVKSDQ
jgi:hypothetical protein